MVLSSSSGGVTFLLTKMIRGNLSLIYQVQKGTLLSIRQDLQDRWVTNLNEDRKHGIYQPSTLSDLLGGSTSMDVDVDSVESELNAYTRVQQVPLDTDPLSVGFVKSDFRGRFLDNTLIDVMWAKQVP